MDSCERRFQQKPLLRTWLHASNILRLCLDFLTVLFNHNAESNAEFRFRIHWNNPGDALTDRRMRRFKVFWPPQYADARFVSHGRLWLARTSRDKNARAEKGDGKAERIAAPHLLTAGSNWTTNDGDFTPSTGSLLQAGFMNARNAAVAAARISGDFVA